MQQNKIWLVYDGECPVCKNYSQVLRIKQSVGELDIVDARENSAMLDEITAAGLDIDQGMVLKMGDQLYYGADAVHALALISSRSGIFNRINYWLFKSKILSTLLYPLLRYCRNILLKFLKKTKIRSVQRCGPTGFG